MPQCDITDFDSPFNEVSKAVGLHAGGEFGLKIPSSGTLSPFLLKQDGESVLNVDLTLFAYQGDITLLIGTKSYPDDVKSIFFVTSIERFLGGLGTEINRSMEHLANKMQNDVGIIRQEVFYHSLSNEIQKVEISLIGQSDSSNIQRFDESQTSIKYVIPKSQLTDELLGTMFNLRNIVNSSLSAWQVQSFKLGDEPIIEEMRWLLQSATQVEYEVIQLDSEVAKQFDVDLKVFNVGVEAGVELQKSLQRVQSKGTIVNGIPLDTEIYDLTTSIPESGKDWYELSTSAFGGLWDEIKDGFSVIVTNIQNQVEQTVEIVSKKVDGVIHSIAKLRFPFNHQLNAQVSAASVMTVESQEITAISWVPELNENELTAAQQHSISVAAGTNFATGGIYSFQPYTLTVAPAASLEINYTDAALAEVNEADMWIFRWNATDANWQPLPTQRDSVNNLLTTEITELGIFAAGADTTPPTITLVQADLQNRESTNSVIIQARISDIGAGVVPDTIKLTINGEEVPFDYNIVTGELRYISNMNGQDSTLVFAIEATDTLGQTTILTEDNESSSHSIHLPLINN